MFPIRLLNLPLNYVIPKTTSHDAASYLWGKQQDEWVIVVIGKEVQRPHSTSTDPNTFVTEIKEQIDRLLQ
jgi:hypothetical protein